MNEFTQFPKDASFGDQIDYSISVFGFVVVSLVVWALYFKFLAPSVQKATAPTHVRKISTDPEVSKILSKFNDPSKGFSCEIIRRTGEGEGKYFDLVTTCLRHREKKITVGTYDKELKKIGYWWTAEYYWSMCDEHYRSLVEMFRYDSKRWREYTTFTHTERLLLVSDFMLARYGPITAETFEPVCSYCENEQAQT